MAHSCIACSIDRVSPAHRFANDQHTCEKNSSESTSPHTLYTDNELPEATNFTHDTKTNTAPVTTEDRTGTASAYTFDNYQEDAGTTAFYPSANTGAEEAIAYTILGLIGEAGEVANKYKKVLRDKGGYADLDDLTAIATEIGDILWYCARLASELGANLSTIATENYRKLNDRKSRDVLYGSGDDR